MLGRRTRVCILVSFVAGSAARAALSPPPGSWAPRPPPWRPRAPWRCGRPTAASTIRATRIVERVVLDGRLDEDLYTKVSSIGGFLQQEPAEGEPATEKTEVWLLFDDEQHLRRRPLLGFASRARGRQRDAARRPGHQRQRELRRHLRHVQRSPERLSVPGQPRRRRCSTATSPTSAT